MSVFEGPASMIFVALTNSPLLVLKSVAPDAKLDDGNFTLIFIVKTANLFNMLSLMIQAINGGNMCTMKM